MKTILAEKALKYLDAVEKGVSQGGEFLTENAAALSHEIVAWKCAEYGVVLTALLVSICTIWVIRSYFQKSLGPKPSKRGPDESERDFQQNQQMWDCLTASGYFISYVVSFILMIVMFNNAVYATKPFFAPRVVVLEEIRNLTR